MNKRVLNIILSSTIILVVLLAYQNIYDNEFHFDDSHTIQDNPYIKDISNLPKFFTVGSETFSSLPANQVYRPVVTSSIAIDYWLSKNFSESKNGFDMSFYHYSMMLTFILLLVLLFAFFLNLFQKARKHSWNIYFAFFATALFGLHTVNAETLNYIISRSDLLSTFFVVASFVVFLYFPDKRKWGLFLIPFVFGILTKLTSAMFIPMVMVYYFVFEYLPMSVGEKLAKRNRLIIQAIVLFVLMLVSVAFIMKMQSDTFLPGTHSRWQYLITMPFVLLHYFISFFVPYNLSADTDWSILESVWNIRFFTGMLFVIAMLFAFYKTYNKKHLAPISFGILWFFIALAPTSSFIPLSEVLNDHRMFYPFVGLTLAVVYLISIFIIKKEYAIRENNIYQAVLAILVVVVLGAHFAGVRQRTEVWDNGESLWYDVTIKSPENGRGLMNYGLRLMSHGDYKGSMEYYQQALEFSPRYSYLFTNMGICYNAMGNQEQAEESFKKALQYGYYSHKPHYYYGEYLLKHQKYQESITEFNISLEMAPQYLYSMYKLMELYAAIEDWENLKLIIAKAQSLFPNDITASYYADVAVGKMTKLDLARKRSINTPDASTFLNLSLQYYFAKKFDSSAWAGNRVLDYDPNNISAYNNICAANNVMGNWEKAIAAGTKSLELNSENQLAKNNLNISYKRQALQNQISETSDATELIDLSLKLYTEEMYLDCVKACEKSLKYQPKNSIAYNNICSAYNAMENWSQAVKAGEKAVEYAPEYQLAKNNLAYAMRMLAAGK